VIKVHARNLWVQSVELSATRLVLALTDKTPLDGDTIVRLTRGKGSRYSLTPDMRLIRNFAGDERQNPFTTATQCLLDLITHQTSGLGPSGFTPS